MARHPSGRLPVDRALDRPATQQRGADLHNDAHHTLAIAPMREADRAARDAKALRYMQIHAPDLIDVLGLGYQPPQASEGRPAVPKDFDCPTCPATRGRQCITGDGRDMRFHVARQRLAAPKETAGE